MLLPIYKVLPKMVDTFDKKVKQLGRLTKDTRRKAFEASNKPSPPVFGPKGLSAASQSSHARH